MHLCHLIVDDFLPNPDAVRAAALRLAYPEPDEPTYFPGRNADQALPLQGLDAVISSLVGEALQPAPGTSHLKPRLALEGQQGKGGIHVDNAHWSAILYLTLDQDCQGGTSFHRHKRTNSEHAPVFPGEAERMGLNHPSEIWEKIVFPDQDRAEAWDTTMVIPMRFNRLALFRSYLWHNAGPSFGTSPETGRLILPLFYIPA